MQLCTHKMEYWAAGWKLDFSTYRKKQKKKYQYISHIDGQDEEGKGSICFCDERLYLPGEYLYILICPISQGIKHYWQEGEYFGFVGE